MSSFDFTDNFSGFNDLFNRAEFLTEAKKSPYAKYHPSFGGITKDLKAAGFSSAPLDTINFIRTSLYNLELISDEELAAAKKGSGFRAKKDNLIALLDAKEDIIEQNKDEIAKEIEDNLARYINRATTNRGKEEKYAAQKAALELAKDIKAGKDMGDAVEDTVGQLDAAESELADSLQMSKEDPTTFIEIKIRDAGRVEDVGNIVSKYANEDGLDISGDTVQFSVDPDTPLAKAVTAHGIDKIEAALKRDVDKISDSVVVVMAPDEDYEEMGYGFDSPEEPDEYSMGEEGGGITEVEDAEDLSAKKARAGKDIGKPGKNFSKIAKSAGKKYGSKAAGERVAGAVLAKMRGNYEGAEDLDHFLTKEQPEDYIPSTDYEDVLDDLVNKDKEKHAIRKLNGENEETLEEGVIDTLERLIGLGVKGARGIADIVGAGADVLGHGMDGVKKVWNTVIPIAKQGGEGAVEAAKHIVDAYHEFKAGYREGQAEAEERLSVSPMLDSYQTSTANYLTEQTASDKRNKKTEVKNQSFKERYKPKTSWQLQELRRYGL